jgi:hypothetical protein
MYYAAKYWQEDLKGLILLDGGTNIKTANPTNTYNLTAVLNQGNSTGKWALEAPNLPGTAVASGWLMIRQYAAQNPGAPAEYPIGTPLKPTTNPLTGKPWSNITDFSAYVMNGPSANVSGGFTNVTVLSQAYAGFDRYWPDRLNLEATAINDWTNCPYVANDYNEYYANVNLPIIAFTSELFGLSRGNGAVQNTTTNINTKNTLLKGYGHMDVYCGIYSGRDVSEPAYQWMLNHTPRATNPTNLIVTNIAAQSVSLAWTDNSNVEIGFKIQRSTAMDFSRNLTSLTVDAGVTAFSDNTVIAGTKYYYRVSAVDTLGDSAPTNFVSVSVPPSAAPRYLAVSSLTQTSVRLTWVDCSNSETGFTIQRATDKAFTQSLQTFTATLNLAQMGAYTDTTATPNTTYYYRVLATSESAETMWSNFARAVTLP